MTPAQWCLLVVWAGFALIVVALVTGAAYYLVMRYARGVSAPGPNRVTRTLAGVTGTGVGFVVFGFVAWLLALAFAGILGA